MILIDDALFESGMKDKLQALGEIGQLLQLAQWQEGYTPQLLHIGRILETTMQDLLEELHQLDDMNRQAFELKEQCGQCERLVAGSP